MDTQPPDTNESLTMLESWKLYKVGLAVALHNAKTVRLGMHNEEDETRETQAQGD